MDEGPTEFVEGVLALVGRTTATEVQGASALSRAELVVKAPTPGDLRIQRGKLKAQERADARSEGSKTFVWTCKRHGKTAFSASQGACETCISEGKVRRREALKTG
jgi:tRNA(Ser,Leu) C12 N-acetylase TAN1